MINASPVNGSEINSVGFNRVVELLSVAIGTGAAATASVAVQRYLAASPAGGVRAVSVTVSRARGFGAKLGASVRKVVSDMDLFKSATGLKMTYLSVDAVTSITTVPSLLNNKYCGASPDAGASTNVTLSPQRAMSASATVAALAYASLARKTILGAWSSVEADIWGGPLFHGHVTVGQPIGPSLYVKRMMQAAATASASISQPAVNRLRQLAVAATASASTLATLVRTSPLGVIASVGASILATLQRRRGLKVSAGAGVHADAEQLYVNAFTPAPNARIVHVAPRYRTVIVPPRVRQDNVGLY